MNADPMPAIRAAVADFPFDGYGVDLDGADPAWAGDLASAIAGALPAAGDEAPAPDFFQPGHGYTRRDGTDFLCVTVTTHPASGERLAIGWLADLTGLHFLVHRHIGHWLHEYDGCKPPEDDDTAYAATRGEPGDGAA